MLSTTNEPPKAVGDKKKRTRSNPKRGGGSTKDKAAVPVVKIPTSKTDASTNWKLLLSQKSSAIAAKKDQGGIGGTKEKREHKPFHLRRDVVKHKRQLMEGTASGSKEDGLNTATENLRISSSSVDANQNEEKKGKRTPIPLLKGLNVLDCFDYTHYGHLRTATTAEHQFLTEPTIALGVDCEMVGVGPLKEDALARVSIVNEFGYCLYDKFVKPKSEVTDYRTEFSGVREEDLKKAEEFTTVMKEVADLIKGHVLVGHSLKSDFDVLFLKHPKNKIRDTSFYYRKRFKKLKTPSLKGLVKDFLKVEIQTGEHNSITDAQAAMKLYIFLREEWEKSICKKQNTRLHKYWLSTEYRRAFQALGWKVK